MKDRVSDEHLASPHFVEWANDARVPDGDWNYCFFEKREDANEKAAWAKKLGFFYAQGEVGIYLTKNDNRVRDYMYRWWNGYFEFSPASDGNIGIPDGARSLHVEYITHSSD